ncbi:unnamed protein product [Paramecium octaurelia]|uniref:Myb-like domain-containing protein n=1 Tax=Paramecium octaurelia TaxID=43137 RepID=A0A8S1TVB2_PAROT|nr:unnamed protein product [Paramecium octaurelia]
MEKQKRKKHGAHNESKSLWNYTLSPGWSQEEVKILKLALQKFGIGKWRSIVQSECLPDKSIGQIYIQTQRMLGQQSLGDFMGLQIDLEKVWIDNNQKKGVMRKNGCVINTGDNPNKEERKQRIEDNRQKYSISQEEINKIKLPRFKNDCVAKYFTIQEIENDQFTTIEKLQHFVNLEIEIDKKLKKIQLMKSNTNGIGYHNGNGNGINNHNHNNHLDEQK